MYEIFCETKFSSAHFLRNCESICKDLHGHNWRVRVYARAEALDEAGFVMDFDLLKSQLDFLARDLDHKNLNDVAPFDEINPTSENMAKYIYDHIAHSVQDMNCEISRVEVYEQDDACAIYTRS